MKLLGLTGPAGSGKDTAAGALITYCGFQRVALADPLKRIAASMFGWDWATLWGPSENRNRPCPKTGVSPRRFLQDLGSVGRQHDPDVWIRLALEATQKVATGARYDAQFGPRPGYSFGPPPTGVVITDVRYANECRAIRDAGGRIWRIDRPGAGLTGEAAQHASEQFDGVEPDAVINNDGTIERLAIRVFGMWDAWLAEGETAE